jgi:hypothetical protein
VFDLEIQRLARVLVQHGGDVVVQFRILTVQRQNRDADDRGVRADAVLRSGGEYSHEVARAIWILVANV